jgi:glycosyltransferase involved in cell wall biosynthesis
MTTDLSELKILYLVKTMDVGGSERFTLNLCKHFVPLVKNVTVFSSGGVFLEELNCCGVNHIENKKASSKKLNDILAIRKAIKDLIIKENFQIVHCQHRIFVTILNTLNLKQVKIVYTANNFFDDYFQKLIFPDIAVSISRRIEKNLQDTLLIKGSKIKNINYGIFLPYKNKEEMEESRKKIRKERLNAKQANQITIGYVGRIIEEKGIFKLLEAAKRLFNSGFDFDLLIKGKGQDTNKVHEYLRNNFLENRATIIETESDINDLYKDIDVLVLPTEMNEGLPLSILEALARGILVVTTDKGAITDVIKNGSSGFILNKGEEELDDKLKHILLNYDKLDLIRQNGFDIVQKNYSLDTMLKKYQDLYLDLI